MIPPRPVETCEGFKKNQFDIPELLSNQDIIELSGKRNLEFYPKVPSIKDFKAYDGYKVQTHFKGGESEGEKRLDKFCKDTLRVVNFRKPMTNPTSL